MLRLRKPKQPNQGTPNASNTVSIELMLNYCELKNLISGKFEGSSGMSEMNKGEQKKTSMEDVLFRRILWWVEQVREGFICSIGLSA